VPNSKTLYNRNALTKTSFREYFDNKNVMDVPITRYDMAQIMTNIMDAMGFSADSAQKAEAQNKIGDYSKIPVQYQDAVKNVFALGIITGYADGSFSGDKTMNRGQGCVVIYRMLQYGQYTPPVNPVDPGNTGNTDPQPKPVQTETSAASGATLANGKPVTVENALAIIDEILEVYPDQAPWWSDYNEAGGWGSTGPVGQGTRDNNVKIGGRTLGRISDAVHTAFRKYGTSASGGCGGFAGVVSDAIFGGLDNGGENFPARKLNSVAQARPGDIVFLLNDRGLCRHVATVASTPTWFDQATWYPETDTYSGMYYVKCYEGNSGGKVSYSDSFYLSEKDNMGGCGYYVEVWTRYPD